MTDPALADLRAWLQTQRESHLQQAVRWERDGEPDLAERHQVAAAALVLAIDRIDVMQQSTDGLPSWLIEVLHVVQGFAEHEHERYTLVPGHAARALSAVPAEVRRAAQLHEPA